MSESGDDAKALSWGTIAISRHLITGEMKLEPLTVSTGAQYLFTEHGIYCLDGGNGPVRVEAKVAPETKPAEPERSPKGGFELL